MNTCLGVLVTHRVGRGPWAWQPARGTISGPTPVLPNLQGHLGQNARTDKIRSWSLCLLEVGNFGRHVDWDDHSSSLTSPSPLALNPSYLLSSCSHLWGDMNQRDPRERLVACGALVPNTTSWATNAKIMMMINNCFY